MEGGVKKEIVSAIAAIKGALSVIETHSQPPHMKGYEFEKQFVGECRARGLRTKKPPRQGHVDVLVNGVRVQCKHVTPNEAGQVFIQPGQRTWYEEDDFDVLAMKCSGRLYIIPMASLPKTNGHVRIQIKPLSYTRFVDCWEVLDGEYQAEKHCGEFLFEGF